MNSGIEIFSELLISSPQLHSYRFQFPQLDKLRQESKLRSVATTIIMDIIALCHPPNEALW